jgi:hypothetical protein
MGQSNLIKRLPEESKETSTICLATHVPGEIQVFYCRASNHGWSTALELYIKKPLTFLRIQHLLPTWDSIGRGNLRGHIF